MRFLARRPFAPMMSAEVNIVEAGEERDDGAHRGGGECGKGAGKRLFLGGTRGGGHANT